MKNHDTRLLYYLLSGASRESDVTNGIPFEQSLSSLCLSPFLSFSFCFLSSTSTPERFESSEFFDELSVCVCNDPASANDPELCMVRVTPRIFNEMASMGPLKSTTSGRECECERESVISSDLCDDDDDIDEEADHVEVSPISTNVKVFGSPLLNFSICSWTTFA